MGRNGIRGTVANTMVDGIRTVEDRDYERRIRKVVTKQASPKPPPPEAPTAYWGIQEFRTRRGKGPIMGKKKTPKGRMPRDRYVGKFQR